MQNWGYRAVVAAAAATMLMGAAAPLANAAESPKAAKPELLLIHGYGKSDKGKDCNGGTWKNALKYYQDAGKMDRDLMTTVGYYEGSAEGGPNAGNCDALVAKADNETKIQDLAKGFANYIHDEYTSKGRPVNVVAHSMGGLVTRVALLGTAEGWKGFPSSVDVNNVATLGTPHQGVTNGNPDGTEQWSQMSPGSGFLKALHADGRELGDSWTKGTEWSVVGSTKDETVSYNSSIDKGNAADQKYGYKNEGDGLESITHTNIRTVTGPHKFNMSFWHKWGDEHNQHHTPDNGWAPLKTAFQAATKKHDGLHEK